MSMQVALDRDDAQILVGRDGEYVRQDVMLTKIGTTAFIQMSASESLKLGMYLVRSALSRILFPWLTCAVAAVLVMANASDADACGRCGLFGNRCKFVKAVVVAPAVAVAEPVIVNRETPVVITNVFPQANGAAVLAPQGLTGYTYGGFQQLSQAYTLDPAAVLRQAHQLATDTQALTKAGLDGYTNVASLALQLNAQTSTPLAQGLAAATVLNAAGLSGNAAQQLNAGPLSVRLYRDSAGQWQVDASDPTQPRTQVQTSARQSVESGRPLPPDAADPSPPAVANSLLSAKCASCHGLSLTEPNGGLYFDAGHQLDCNSAMKAIKAVRRGTMPKNAKTSPLSEDEKARLVDELTSLVTASD